MSNSKEINIGIAQIKNSTNIKKNSDKIFQCLDVFSTTNVDLVLFPECSLTGFSGKLETCSEEIILPIINKVELWCSQFNKSAIIPTAIEKDGKIYNSGYFINNRNTEKFYKIGLTESEKTFFSTHHEYKKTIFELNNFRFILLICIEAEHNSELYFKSDDVDFILWPGYWGWKQTDEWGELKSDGEKNLTYKNSIFWSKPIIQSNFSFNDLKDYRNSGPQGLSVVVDEKNQLKFRGSFEKEECFSVNIVGGEVRKAEHLTFLS
jgi:predicted amidohydrolase